jgi:hypothetical protein
MITDEQAKQLTLAADPVKLAEFERRRAENDMRPRYDSTSYPDLMRAHPWPEVDGLPLFWRAIAGTVFCVGCGPSLANQDPELTRSGVVLGCNRAWKWRDPDAAVFLDSRALIESAREGASDHCPLVFASPGILPHAVVGDNWTAAMRTFPRVHLTQGLGVEVPGMADRNLSEGWGGFGGSVIFAAIQLAMWLKPARIVLLGVDLDYSDKRACYFYGHPEITKGHEVALDPALAAVEYYQEECKRVGIELLNCNDRGNIKSLPMVRLEDLL